jgi:dihydropteroate synthase
MLQGMATSGDDSLPIRFPGRATRWQLRTRCLDLPLRPLVMGIVNVTPDSFSDGGLFFDEAAAIERGLRLAADGADLLDVGGESTRPYSQSVPEAEELRRVRGVVAALCRRTKLPISIDTSKAAVAQAAIDCGAEIVNDVTALAGDPRMLEVVRGSGAGAIAMHMPGSPQTMNDNPRYADVVADVFDYLRGRRDKLLGVGIDPSRLALDPGIGFGKLHPHSLELLSHCDQFHELGCPLVVGHSRKGFIGHVLGDKEADRTAGTIGVALSLARQGVQILRVHDVAPVRQALLLFEATGGLRSK